MSEHLALRWHAPEKHLNSSFFNKRNYHEPQNTGNQHERVLKNLKLCCSLLVNSRLLDPYSLLTTCLSTNGMTFLQFSQWLSLRCLSLSASEEMQWRQQEDVLMWIVLLMTTLNMRDEWHKYYFLSEQRTSRYQKAYPRHQLRSQRPIRIQGLWTKGENLYFHRLSSVEEISFCSRYCLFIFIFFAISGWG